ncbi:MAG: extracellular solute-binding protein [Deltaproteobacteria bacterium]|jgi:arabinogalactan oligomer/maltooligosaccharide transport system substrate-binding protein
MKLRTLAFALAATMFAAPAVAKTKVVLWHAYRATEKKALEKVAADFNKSQGDVEVELVAIPYDAFGDKITAAIPRGKGPDLFIFAQDRLGDWAASQTIEAIDFWVTDETRDQFLEPTLEALTYDDQIYGLPMAFKTLALFYNKGLVKKAPTTTDELIAEAKKVTKGGKFGLVYENTSFWYQGTWLQGFGGAVFDKRGKPTLASPQVIDSMKFAQKLAHGSGVMPQEVTSTLVTSLFNQGKAAFVVNGPWFIGEIDKKVKWGVAPLPKIVDAGGKPARPFLTADGLMMSAKAKDKKAAFAVMTYFTGVDAAVTMATIGRQPTANKAAYANAKVKNDPVLAVFKKQLAVSRPTPNTPAMRMVWSPVTAAMNKIINQKADAASTMKATQDEVAKLVKTARR